MPGVGPGGKQMRFPNQSRVWGSFGSNIKMKNGKAILRHPMAAIETNQVRREQERQGKGIPEDPRSPM